MKRTQGEMDAVAIWGTGDWSEEDIDMENRVIREQLQFGEEPDEDGNIRCEHCYGCTGCIDSEWLIECRDGIEIVGAKYLDGYEGPALHTRDEVDLYVAYLDKLIFIGELTIEENAKYPEIMQDWNETYGEVVRS